MNLLKKIWRPLLAISLIVILIKKGPFQIEQLKLILTHTKILLLGFSVLFIQTILGSYRWKLFINLIADVSFIRIFKLNLVGYFFNYFIPGGVGGDIVKALELSRGNQSTRSEALSTVMSDRIFGLFAMASFTFIFLLIEYFMYAEPYLTKFLIMSALLFFSILLSLLFLPAIFIKISTHLSKKEHIVFNKLEKLMNSLHFTFLTFKNYKLQIISFIISFFCQLLTIYFMYEVVGTLGVTQPSFLIFFALCCFALIASAIPIFPAGIGVGQAAIYIIFSHIGDDIARSTITAITAFQIFNFVYALIGGAIFSFMPKVKVESAI